MDVLLGLDLEGLPNSEYVFLNVDTGVYLCHEDETFLNTETSDAGYLEILRHIQNCSVYCLLDPHRLLVFPDPLHQP